MFALGLIGLDQILRLGFRLRDLLAPVMYGGSDQVTSPRGSEMLYQQPRGTDKALKLRPDDRHQVFDELDADAVIATMGDRLDERVM